MRNAKRSQQLTLLLVLTVLATIIILPFLWMIITSFDEAALLDIPMALHLFPERPSTIAYQMTMQNIPMLKYIGNSFAVAAGVCIVSLYSALSSGYALSKIRFKGYKVVLLIGLMTMMVPMEVTMVPQFFLFQRLKLINSYWAFYLPATVYIFGTFFAKQFMDTLPGDFREAAMIDGAGELRTGVQVYLPLCKPLIATLLVLLFLGAWNDFLWPLIVLTKSEKYTVQIGMAMFTYQRGERIMPALRMASAVISIFPVLTVYLLFQPYIVESVALSGVKQ